MRTVRRGQLLLKAAILLSVIVVGVAAVGHRWSSRHVRYISGNESASLNCLPCHVLYRSRFIGQVGGLIRPPFS